MDANQYENHDKDWGEKQLRQCMQFAAIFPDESIVYTVRIQLSWTHLRMLIYMDDPLKRSFYLEMCRLEKRLSRQLQERITINNRDYYIDLLFYHRRLKFLVAKTIEIVYQKNSFVQKILVNTSPDNLLSVLLNHQRKSIVLTPF